MQQQQKICFVFQVF